MTTDTWRAHVALTPEAGAGGTIVSALLFVAGVSTMLAITRFGIGTSPDAVVYIQAARALAGGDGDATLVQHAPMFSLLLALGGMLGVDPLAGARWLNAGAFGLNILLVGGMVRAVTPNRPLAWLLASLLFMASAPVLGLHALALSEPVFLVCTLAGLWLVARHLDQPAERRLLAAAAAIGLTLLTRYAGAAVVLTGAAAIVLVGSRPMRQRARDATLFVVLATLPLAAWLVRNVASAGSATGREISFHPVGLSHAWEALYTVSGWLLIPQGAPNALRFAAWLAIAVMVAATVVHRRGAAPPIPAIVKVLVLFTGIYAAFLATSISFLDANTPLDNRILLPVFAASVVLGAYVLASIWPEARRPAATYLLAGILVLFVGGHAVAAVGMAAAGYRDGWGFTSRAWQQSPILARVRSLHASLPLFSNAPEVVYLHTGRTVDGIPRTRFLMSRQDNPEFDAQVSALDHRLRADCGVIVYVRNLNQKTMPAERDLQAYLSLDLLADEPDGALLGVAACPQ